MRATKFLPVLVLAAAGSALAAGDPKLDGRWEVVSFNKNGKADATWVGAVREHAGDRYTMAKAGGKAVSGTMKVDPDKKAIDLMPDEGQYKGKTLLGVYAFGDDGQLTIVFAEPGKDRPAEAKAGPGLTATVYRPKK